MLEIITSPLGLFMAFVILVLGVGAWRLYQTREHLPKWFLALAAVVTVVLIILVAAAMLGDLVEEDDQQFELSDEFLRDARENLCREQPENCPGVSPTRFAQVKSRYEQWVEAVLSRDFDGQYELQVPPSQRTDCPRTLFLDTIKASLDANPGAIDSLVDAYESATYQGQSTAGLDRTIIEVEITARNELTYLDFRRVEGQWYFYDHLLEDTRNPLHECNPK